MERIVFLIVCALCCASFFIAQAMHGGNGRKGSTGSQNRGSAKGPHNTAGAASDLQAQLEESKKRIRESEKQRG